MIGYLRGLVLRCEDDSCLLDVQGIGYRVHVGGRMTLGLKKGESLELWIESLCHEGVISLFGFLQEEEQCWFRWLIGIQGVGGRVAQSLLNFLPPLQLSQEIVRENGAALKRADGIGPKLANRLITELKDRASAWQNEYRAQQSSDLKINMDASDDSDGHFLGSRNPPFPIQDSLEKVQEDVVLALTALGYKKNQAAQAVYQALMEVNLSNPPSGEDLLKRALIFV